MGTEKSAKTVLFSWEPRAVIISWHLNNVPEINWYNHIIYWRILKSCLTNHLQLLHFAVQKLGHLLTYSILICSIVSSKVFLSFLVQTQSQSHVTTDDQSVSPSWCRGLSGSHDQILIFVWHLLSIWGAPFDERSGQSFVLVTWTASVQ
jgi:hypothetical protein